MGVTAQPRAGGQPERRRKKSDFSPRDTPKGSRFLLFFLHLFQSAALLAPEPSRSTGACRGASSKLGNKTRCSENGAELRDGGNASRGEGRGGWGGEEGAKTFPSPNFLSLSLFHLIPFTPTVCKQERKGGKRTRAASFPFSGKV